MTLQERLAQLFPAPHKHGLQAEIAKACKVAPASVSNWFKDPAKVSTISLANAEAICAKFQLDVNPRWLSDGTGVAARTATAVAPPAKVEPQLEEALRTLGKAIAASDDLSRLQVGSLLETWIHQPHRNEEIERRIIGLLRTAAVARPRQSVKAKEEHR